MVIVERMHTATEGCVLAFFTVVASCSNLSTSFSAAKIVQGERKSKFICIFPSRRLSSNCEVRLKIVQPTNETRVEDACILCLVRRRFVSMDNSYIISISITTIAFIVSSAHLYFVKNILYTIFSCSICWCQPIAVNS